MWYVFDFIFKSFYVCKDIKEVSAELAALQSLGVSNENIEIVSSLDNKRYSVERFKNYERMVCA